MYSKNQQYENKKGFVALITAIILSAILIAVTAALNQSGFFVRAALLDSEYKEKSVALVQACANIALLNLAANPVYAGNEAVSVQGDSCFIRPTKIDVPIVGENTIEVNAVFQEAVTNISVVINAVDLTILSWDEVPYF